MRPLIDYPFELFKKIDIQDAYPLAERWQAAIRRLPNVHTAQISGELRRGKPAVNQIEIAVATTHPDSTLEDIIRIAADDHRFYRQENHAVFHFDIGIDLVVWFSAPACFGSLLQQTTGSQAHHGWLIYRAALKGLKYQSGLIWQEDQPLAFKDETALYKMLGIPWVPPELREGLLEDEWLMSDDNFQLLTREDLIADLHIHSNWSDGKNSLSEMADAAIQNGFTLIAITDHSPHPMRSRYSDPAYLMRQNAEIDQLNQRYEGKIEILKGVEVDILPDGSLDLADDVLAQMDIVIASIHMDYDQPQEVITARTLRAIQNPYVNIIGHPGGRLLPMEGIYKMDWDKIIRAAAEHDVALEINSHKSQPLFDDRKVHLAAQMGVPIAMNSDAHHANMFANSRYGMFIARRAGLSREQVLNAWPKDRIKSWLRRKKGSA